MCPPQDFLRTSSRNYKRARSLIQEKKNIYRDIIFTPSFYYECNEESGKNPEILCKILLGFFASIEQYTKTTVYEIGYSVFLAKVNILLVSKFYVV